MNSGSAGMTLEVVTLACAHFGSLEMLNLKVEVSWRPPPSQHSRLRLTWLEFSTTSTLFGLVLHRWSSSPWNLIWHTAAGWTMIFGDNGQQFSLIFCSILEDSGVGTFQTKIQPSRPTWKHYKMLSMHKLPEDGRTKLKRKSVFHIRIILSVVSLSSIGI